MNRTHIKDFCDKFGQQKAADIMGCSQGNISQIINQAHREIVFELNDDGTYSWLEIRRPKLRTHNQQEAKQ